MYMTKSYDLCMLFKTHIQYKIKIMKLHVRTLPIMHVYLYLARFRRIESRLKD